MPVARSRSNRVFYQSPVISEAPAHRGHPAWYGERFDLKAPDTWHEPTEVSHISYKTRHDRTIHVTITAWSNMLMRGTKVLSTHQFPFTLLRIESVDEFGQSLFRPMWLIVVGERRGELSVVQVYQAYRQRFDIEHYFFLDISIYPLLLGRFKISYLLEGEHLVKKVRKSYE
ncbi:hypothetical protein TUMEXPCC7403_21730 [Tumidithrix helvetica PCC 7403]